jgi:hypothetical protein
VLKETWQDNSWSDYEFIIVKGGKKWIRLTLN